MLLAALISSAPLSVGQVNEPPGRATAEVSPWRPDVKRLNELLPDATAEGRTHLQYPKALRMLASLLRDRPHADFKRDPSKKKVGGYELVSPAKLANPRLAQLHRARPVEVVGKLIAWQELDPSGTVPPSNESGSVVHGYLEAEGGVRVRFLSVQPDPDVTLPPVGGRAKVMGVFYRLCEEKGRIMPFILAKRVASALPLKLTDSLPGDLAKRIRRIEARDTKAPREGEVDHRGQEVPYQEDAFFELAGYILKRGPKLIPPKPVLLTGMKPLDKPEQYRLKVVRAKGVLVYISKESFDFPDMRKEDAPVLGCYHAILASEDPAESIPISVLIPSETLPEAITKWIAGGRDARRPPVIEVDAIYYRLNAYETRGSQGKRRLAILPCVIGVGLPRAVG